MSLKSHPSPTNRNKAKRYARANPSRNQNHADPTDVKSYTKAQFEKLIVPKLVTMEPEEFHTLMTTSKFTPAQMNTIIEQRSQTCNLVKMLAKDPKPNYLQYVLLALEALNPNLAAMATYRGIREHMEQSFHLKSREEIVRLLMPAYTDAVDCEDVPDTPETAPDTEDTATGPDESPSAQ